MATEKGWVDIAEVDSHLRVTKDSGFRKWTSGWRKANKTSS